MSSLPFKPKYFVDTCSFTELRRAYPRESFDPVWGLLERLAKEGALKSVEEIYLELKKQDDVISAWVSQFKEIFLPPTDDIQLKVREILSKYPSLLDLRKGKSGGDPFLIAAAVVHGGSVVTQERKSGGPPRLKIPDVCEKLKVPCIALVDMLRAENLRT
jgi:hypothetical protein